MFCSSKFQGPRTLRTRVSACIQQIAIAKGFVHTVISITKHWVSEAPNAFSMRSPTLPCVMRSPLTLPAGCRSDLPPVSGLGTRSSLSP
jgi:hypothetical protein